LLLRHGGFGTPPLAPEQALGGAKREQAKRLLTDRRRRVRGWCICCEVRRRERGKTNGIRPAAAPAIELRENGVDAEECRGRPHRSPVGTRCKIAGSVGDDRFLGRERTGCRTCDQRNREPRSKRKRAKAPQFQTRCHDVPLSGTSVDVFASSFRPNLLSGRSLRPSLLMRS
jgi:hypothetical protein